MFRNPSLLFLSAAAAAVLGVAACSATSNDATSPAEVGTADGGGGGTSDGSTIDPGDAGTEASSVKVPPLPVIPNQGGPVIASPEIVTVTWTGDTIVAGLEAFDAWMIKSAFWKDLMAEWGVGPGTYVGAYHVPTAAPPTLDDADIQTLLATGFTKGTIPPPNGRRIYTIYPPSGTDVTSFGSKGCDAFQAYHSSFSAPATSAGPAAIALYAVAPRCPSGDKTPLDFITWGQSHEVMETASDPIAANPAWRIDAQSLATPELGENADLCTGQPTRVDGFLVTRNWSNVAAKAGQRPCVPAPPGPMFGAFIDPGEITILPGKAVTMKVHPYGAVGRFGVEAYSPDPALTVSLDKTKVSEGDDLTLTVKASSSWVEVEGQNLVFLYAQTSEYLTKRHVILHAK